MLRVACLLYLFVCLFACQLACLFGWLVRWPVRWLIGWLVVPVGWLAVGVLVCAGLLVCLGGLARQPFFVVFPGRLVRQFFLQGLAWLHLGRGATLLRPTAVAAMGVLLTVIS